MRLAVIIPTLNEACTIAQVVKDFKKELPQSKVIVYDGNSIDGTADIAKKAGAVVIWQRSSGKGAAMAEALRRIKADYFLFVDGDGTYLATDAKFILRPILDSKADMVIGIRTRSNRQAMSSLHCLGNRIINWLASFLFHMEIKDILSGYRVLDKKLARDINLNSAGFEIETELTLKALIKGFRVKEVPIQYLKRPEGGRPKLRSFRDGLKIIITILKLAYERRYGNFYRARQQQQAKG